MARRRSAVVLLVALLAVTLTGCERARAGARCRVGAPLARDATHVLMCQAGRWRRVMTIGQAAQIIVGNLPGSVTSMNGPNATVVAGAPISPSPRFQVLRRNGQPLGGATVTLAGIGLASPVTAGTGPDGVVDFGGGAVANGRLGGWTLTASVDGTDVDAGVSMTTTVAAPAAITILSGGDQTKVAGQPVPDPLVVRVTDRFGNPIQNRRVYVRSTFSVVWADPSDTTTDADGTAQFNLRSNNFQPRFRGSVFVDFDTYPLISANITVNVVPGPVGEVDIESGDGQTTATSTPFSAPLRVRVRDGYYNAKEGVTVTFTTSPSGGASAALSSSTAVTDSNGFAEVTATAGASPGTYQVTASAGGFGTSFTLTNT